MVRRCHGRQRRLPQRRHRDRVRIVRIVLVRPSRSQQPRPRRQRRRDIHDTFARRDELLREEIPTPPADSTTHRPIPELAGPHEQLPDLAARRPHPDRRQLDLTAIDHHRGVRRRMRIDTDHHRHRIILPDPSGEKPWSALPIPEDGAARTSFEPHHGEIR
jgi:hypothetical protein